MLLRTRTDADGALRVLLIDDDELIAGSLQRYLAAHGCSVDVAPDRPAAERQMSGRSYAVVLADPYLTGEIHRDAPSLVATIRSHQPGASILLVTAYGSPELERVAEEQRVSALVDKPQSITALSRLVLNALQPPIA